MTSNFDVIINLFTYINFYETYDFYLKFTYVKKYIIRSRLIIIRPTQNLLCKFTCVLNIH